MPHPSPEGEALSRCHTVLVIDSDDGTRGEICRILREAGYDAIPARHAVEAQWCVERHGAHLDLIVTDLAPPEADVFHLGIPIGAVLGHRPVLFLSTRRRESLVAAGLLRPDTPFLQKPAAPYLLLRAVRAAITRWQAPPAA